MKFFELIVLLPCHSLEDFPIHHQGNEAEGLLAAWSALWHPALIASSGALPTWFRADAPSEELASRLIIVPEASESLLLSGWVARAKSEGAAVLRKLHRRDELVGAALDELYRDAGPDGSTASRPPRSDESAALARDFLALGTAFLWVELLTRQMRYMSNIDEVHLKNETVAGAKAWEAGDLEAARRHLGNCFEVITEARERFYPVNCYLVDLTLVAESTLGAGLAAEIDGDAPTNLLVSGQLVERIEAEQPAIVEKLKLALDHRRVAVVGGEYLEDELPIVPREGVLDNFLRGIAIYQRVLGQRPTVFGRRRFGLSPALPLVLSRLGFEAAMHFTLDDGQFPLSSQSKTRWEGLDPSAIDALCRVPLDAASAETFLNFPRTMGESMDSDHVATVVFAHWPGQASPFYEDLRRIAAYGAPLGKFITLDEYFATTDSPGDLTRFKADQYRAPYLWQAVVRKHGDPLSKHMAGAKEQSEARSTAALAAFARLLSSAASTVAATPETAAAQLAGAIVSGRTTGTRGCFVANAESFARRLVVDVSKLERLPAVEGPVVGVQESSGKKLALVEVPGCGFAWLASTDAAPTAPGRAKPAKAPRPMAEGNLLRNEFFEVTVHPTTGGIRSIHAASARGNRLSQQLAFRLPAARPKAGDLWRDPDEDAPYSVMCVDAIDVLSAGPAVGEIASRGRLMSPEGQRLAGFVQTLRLVRGSRRLEIDVELDIDEPPRADPWNSYYACRFAWPDDVSNVRRSVGMTAQPTTAKRLESPEFIELQAEKWKTTLLVGGLPYHRRTSDRMLDTLLVVRGETCRRFRLAAVLDAAHPAQEAIDFAAPVIVNGDVPLATASSSAGWLFHIDARNVVVTSWQRIDESSEACVLRVRLLETEGRPGRVTLRAFRAPSAAHQVDFLGQTMAELPIQGDAVAVDIASFEWIELELSFPAAPRL